MCKSIDLGRSMKDARKLSDLVSVGQATLKDFDVLGVRTIQQLARSKAELLYKRLCRKTGQRHDICTLDVFSATIAQAKNPRLPKEQCNWWYWSKLRKKRKGTHVSIA